MTMPKIKSACVRCKLKNDKEFIYAEGRQHADCYDYLSVTHNMYPRIYPKKYDFEEGFLLADGSFVDRVAATDIAKKENQLSSRMISYKDMPVWVTKQNKEKNKR